MKKTTHYQLPTTNYSLTIGWLYPDLMSTYGDHGNILSLQRRLEWRGIEAIIKPLSIGSKPQELSTCDLIFMGGAQDRQQTMVANDFKNGKKEILAEMIEDNTPGLYICGAYQVLGKYYKEADGTIIDGLGILDLYTENPGPDSPRLIGNIAITVDSSLFMDNRTTTNYKLPTTNYVVGFENHGGRTYLGERVKPLGKVINGSGNNGKDTTEGAVYKNSIGSYLHGPILPKNPQLTDYLLSKALEHKYKVDVPLSPLDDSLEKKAHEIIVRKLGLGV
jgi:hypothetical protein